MRKKLLSVGIEEFMQYVHSVLRIMTHLRKGQRDDLFEKASLGNQNITKLTLIKVNIKEN